jgi:dipeptidyl aminopeptidase/acylaminoacyl peptidase
VLGLVAGHHASAQEPVDPHRPPAIKTQSVPVVPQEIFDKLERYESVRSAGFAGWAPDGSGMLVRTRFGNSLQLHRVYEPGGRREQITFFEEPVSGGFLQNAKDNAILLSMSRGGNENYQVHWLDQANFRTVLLTDGKSRYSIGPANADATRIVLSSNERNGRDTDLYIADPRKPDARELVFATDRQFWTAADWSQDGKTLLLARYVSANESHPALFDVAAKRLTELPLPTDAPAAISAMAFSPDGKYAYVATDAGSEFRQLALLDLGTKKYTWLTQDIPWDISDLAVDEKSGAVAAVTNENGLGRLYLFEGRSPIELKRRAVALPAGIISGLEFSPDGKSLGMTLAASNAPAEAYSLDLASGQTTRWTFSEVGGLDPSKFVSPEQVRFKSFDGREVPAYYYRVKDASPARKAPVLINIHGGPESQFRPFFSGATQFYVHELGIAVIAPNVRGSSGYGKTYLKLDNAEKREDSVKDIGALLDWIAQQPELDASRVAVAGGSYGGYMTLA